jgi:hypothetical protein
MLGGARLLRSAGAGGGEAASGDDAFEFDRSSCGIPFCAVEAGSLARHCDNRPGREAVTGFSRGGGETAKLDDGRVSGRIRVGEVRLVEGLAVAAGTLFGTSTMTVRL